MNEKLQSYSKGGEQPELMNRTIPEIQDEITKQYPRNEFLVSLKTGERLNFRDFDRLTDRVAKGLISMGINKGDRIGITMPNSVEWITSYFAAFKIGAYPVNITPTLKSDTLEYMVTQPQVKCVITDSRNLDILRKGDYPWIKEMVLVNDKDSSWTPDWEDLLDFGKGVRDEMLRERSNSLKPRDIAGLCYTSGTTGDPKGAMLTHCGLINNCNFMSYILDYHQDDIFPLTVPMFHFFGWVVSLICMLKGMKLVIPTSYVRPESILECLDTESCTTMGSAPQIFNFFVNQVNLDKYDLSSLRHCFSGSDVLSHQLVNDIYDKLNIDNLQNAWGSTELGGAFTLTPRGASKSETIPVGKIIPQSEIKIVDPDTGKTLPRGEEGEIWCRGPSLFTGYWEKPDETEEKITDEGWLKTGDVGKMDDEEFTHFVGRLDEMFKKGAKKVAPAPIENVLKQHPEIVDAGVVGVPDEKYGLEVAAFVQLSEETLKQIGKSKEKASYLRTEMQKMARKKLEPFKVPKYVKFVKELPRTATGKIRHFILQENAKNLAN